MLGSGLVGPPWSGPVAEFGHGDGATEPDVLAAVESGLPGDELAGGLGVEVRVEGAPDDPTHRPVGGEGFVGPAGDRVEAVAEPLPHVAGHLVDAVGRGAGRV